MRLSVKHLKEIRNGIKNPYDYYKTKVCNDIPCAMISDDTRSYYYNNYSDSIYSIVRGQGNQKDQVIYAHDVNCDVCDLMRKNYNYFDDKFEHLIAIRDALKHGYWFMQIMYGKRTQSGTYTTHMPGCEKRHKLVYSTIACSVDHLINFPIYTVINRQEPTERNINNQNYYNTITAVATKLYLADYNKYSGLRYKYFGFPFMNFEDRVYTYYNPMNILNINSIFRKEFYNHDNINNEGFVLALANTIPMTEQNLNYNDSYDYISFGKMFAYGNYSLYNFFAQFMNILDIYKDINTLQAMMFVPNKDVLEI